MKARVEKNPRPALTRKQRQGIELQLGVYLDNPIQPVCTGVQQYAVYDEDEIYVGDVTSQDDFFFEEELVLKIKRLFEER